MVIFTAVSNQSVAGSELAPIGFIYYCVGQGFVEEGFRSFPLLYYPREA